MTLKRKERNFQKGRKDSDSFKVSHLLHFGETTEIVQMPGTVRLVGEGVELSSAGESAVRAVDPLAGQFADGR